MLPYIISASIWRLFFRCCVRELRSPPRAEEQRGAGCSALGHCPVPGERPEERQASAGGWQPCSQKQVLRGRFTGSQSQARVLVQLGLRKGLSTQPPADTSLGKEGDHVQSQQEEKTPISLGSCQQQMGSPGLGQFSPPEQGWATDSLEPEEAPRGQESTFSSALTRSCFSFSFSMRYSCHCSATYSMNCCPFTRKASSCSCSQAWTLLSSSSCS